jgi:nucleoside-diphosphate-sugar epimerase
METILITGSTGQIGSELTMSLRSRYGNPNIVAGFINSSEPEGELLESGTSVEINITNPAQITAISFDPVRQAIAERVKTQYY